MMEWLALILLVVGAGIASVMGFYFLAYFIGVIMDASTEDD